MVSSPNWQNGSAVNAGAITWGNGSDGSSTGVIGSANSLVGTRANDLLGTIELTEEIFTGGVTALTNGNYVVSSPNWDSSTAIDVGAVTWGNGSTGSTTGAVSATNSLVGSSAYDAVGRGPAYTNGIVPLNNGNYVVNSPDWDNGLILTIGAVTWANGSTGISGLVSASNSLIGSSQADNIGRGGVTALTNGNYVVSSPYYDGGPALEDAGAVTWATGMGGTAGFIENHPTLYGAQKWDNIGLQGVTALSNGHYVVNSPRWDASILFWQGAVTWGNGSTGSAGEVLSTNSLFGAKEQDLLGSNGITALTNGNYIVNSSTWDLNSTTTDVGALTWGNGNSNGGSTGIVDSANSLIGSTSNDQIGTIQVDVDVYGNGVQALSNGNYVASSPFWDNGTLVNAGAVTLGDGWAMSSGSLPTSTTIVGEKAQSGLSLSKVVENPRYAEIIVGISNENRVAFLSTIYINSVGPANALVGLAYSHQFTAVGAPAPNFSLASGSLPPGLTLNSNGSLSGTPSKAGIYTFNVLAKNGVQLHGGQAVTLTIHQAPAFSSVAPASGLAGQSYSHQFTAVGFPVPSFSLASGSSLPAGLSLNPTSGVLSGTPTAAGSFSFKIVASNGIGANATQNVTLTINQAAAFSSSAPASGLVGQSYSHQFTAVGFPAPSFSLANGSSLPAGLTLDSTSGVLSGIPTAAGSFSFTIAASNGIGANATQQVNLTIQAAPVSRWYVMLPGVTR